MKASIQWIKELLPALKATPAAIERRLTAAGLEVEAVEREADAFEGVVVGEVREVGPHPGADQLKVTKVWDGQAEHQVVCGAPNVAAGQKVPFATLGAKLPNGMEIARRTIRGVESFGMLCSAEELGLPRDVDGLLVLKPGAKPGKPIADVLGKKDTLFELSVTPNRPDVLSHFGLARELSALFELPMPKLSVRLKEGKKAAKDLARVEIQDRNRCARYAGRVITGVKVGPSPDWVKARLAAVGQRSISNVVDATNLVLMELGHPLHAFDLARLRGHKVVVRTASPGETISLLDGSTKTLTSDDLVIADGEGPVALAGVMGGANSEVHEGTQDLLLESAWFDPASVRRTAKRHGLHTEASHRFERGADQGMVELALDRVAALILELAGGQVAKGPLLAGASSARRRIVGVRPERATALIGRAVGKKELKDTLGALGLDPTKAPAKQKGSPDLGKDALWFEVPTWRVDLALEVDLIEEVARLGGYDQIPTEMPAAAKAVWTKGRTPSPEQELRTWLAQEGFLETIALAFHSEAEAQIFGLELAKGVRLANPLGEETRLMRLSLLPALVRSARLNQDHLPSLTDLRLFELGRTFRWAEGQTAGLPEESLRLGVLWRGARSPAHWSQKSGLVDAYDLKGLLEGVLSAFGIGGVHFVAEEAPYLHPASGTRMLRADGGLLGHFGQLHPKVAERIGLEGPPVWVADLDVDALHHARGARPQFRALAKFPPAQRDLSFFLDRHHLAAQVVSAIEGAAAGKALESCRIFDVYEGQGVPAGKKSMAVSLTFRAPDRTLTDAEVEGAQQAIVTALTGQLGAEIRMA